MSTSSNSGNSTSLYGEAGTPIPDSSGNVIVRGDLYVLSGNILTTATTGNIFPANATTINLGLAATSMNIGAATGTTTINNALTAGGTVTAPGADFGNITIGVATDNTITTTSGDLDITATGNNGVNISSGNDAPTLITRNTNNTNTGTRSLALAVQSSGTPTVGFGNSLEWQVETAPGNTENAGFVSVTSTDITPASEDFRMNFGLMQNGALADTKMFVDSTGSLTLDNDLTVGGVNVNLQPSANFLYSENNNSTNRPEFQSTSGNSSGLRVRAPNTTTSASSTFSVNNSSDSANTEFLALQARGSALGDTFRFLTGEFIANVFSASNKSISFTDYTNTYATVNPAGPTIGTDLTTKTYVDALPAGGVTSVTGGTHVTASPTTGAVVVSTDATNLNTASTIVARDASGNFSAGTITAALTGNATTATTATQVSNSLTAGTHLSGGPFNGSAAVTLTTDATDANTVSTIVARDASGNFSAGVGTFTTVATPAVTYSGGALTITAGGVDPSILTLNSNQTTLALDGGVGYGDSLLTTAFNSLTWAHTAGGLDTGSVNGIWNWNADGTTDFPNYTFPYASGAANTVLTNDGSGNVSWALPGGGGSTFGNVTVGVDTDQTISTTSGDLILQTAAGVNAGTITMASGVNGDITIAPNGTGNVILSDDSYVLGQLVATRNSAYVIPPSPLTTVAGQNGIVVASSSGGLGFGANIAVRYHSGDTTAGIANAAAVNMSGASGTNSAPGGAATNQVLGSMGFDGYTAGTSNNYAATIATTNQGAGTNGMIPLQAQGYARQAFTNSTTFTTAVTGASGTGSVATLNFTLQNTAPYIIGQTVTIAGMTPSGYNGTVVLTGVTTSSVSYANTTTGFTSGGTIAAVNTVTQAGMGFRVRGYANSTNMTLQNRFNFMDLTASTANFKSAAYTFANDVITGSTLTASNYMTLGAAVGSVNQDTFTIKNTAATTTYGTFTSTGTTISGAGLSQITRTTVGVPTVIESRPSFNIQLTRSDQAAPTSGDGTGFRSRVAGSNGTNYTMTDLSSSYSNTGDYAWFLNLANGDQTGATFTSVTTINSRVSATTISAGTPSATPGASTVATKLTIDAAKITAAVPIQFPNYTVAAAGALTGALGQQIAISNSSTSPTQTADGMMAFWRTDVAGWHYIHDNRAI